MLDKSAIQEIAMSQAVTAVGTEVGNSMSQRRGALVIPESFKLNDLETFLPNRRRQRGIMATTSVADFTKYADKNKEEGAAIFIEAETMKAVAVLNLGTAEKPGHADNLAWLELKKTAAFKALSTINGAPMKQQQAAEFMEDWAQNIACLHDAEALDTSKAIAAVRSITVEAARKLEVETKQLSASRSAFDSVQASSKVFTLPTEIRFTCLPYQNLAQRTFAMRLSIVTSNDVASVILRIIKLEEHEELMAQELAALIEQSIEADSGVSVMLGKYNAGR